MAAITARQRTGWATANFVVIALALIPVLWMVSLSFKTPTAVLDPSFIPRQWTWGNYTRDPDTRRSSSGRWSTRSASASSPRSSPWSWPPWRPTRSPGCGSPARALLIGMALLIAMFPLISLVTPLFNIERALGLFDTWPGLIIPYVTFGLPLAIYTLSAFFREIPWELEKAAKVDGATPFQAFGKVIAPLAAPGMVTTAILVFLSCWNDFLFAISLTSTISARTAPAAHAVLQRRLAVHRSDRVRSRPPRWSSPSRSSSSCCSSSAGSSPG